MLLCYCCCSFLAACLLCLLVCCYRCCSLLLLVLLFCWSAEQGGVSGGLCIKTFLFVWDWWSGLTILVELFLVIIIKKAKIRHNKWCCLLSWSWCCCMWTVAWSSYVRTHEGRSLFDLVCSAADRCADGIDDNVKRDRGDPIRRSARVNMQCSTHFDFVKWSLGEAPFDIFP